MIDVARPRLGVGHPRLTAARRISSGQGAPSCPGWVVLALVVCATQAGPSPGYLPVIGPAPLRFVTVGQSPPAPLPPLAMEDTEPSATSHESAPHEDADRGGQVSSTEPPPAPVQELDWIADYSHPVPSTNAQPATAAPAGGQTNVAPLVLPTTLIPYFTERNGPNRETTVAVPIQFNPAVPPLPSSTATYTSEPKR